MKSKKIEESAKTGKKGFTLAEVLITLLVIGVIAALTIPGLIVNIQNEQYKTALKRVYSDLAQVASRLIVDNGGTLANLCPSAGNSDCIRNSFVNYMSYIKICARNTSLGNCWPAEYNWLDGDSSTTGNYGSGAILSNGASLIFDWVTPDCSSNVGSPPIYQSCGWIFIDVNGLNPPNRWGKDIFWIYISGNSLKPRGIDGDGTEATCRPNNHGEGCAGVYLRNQISN